MLDRRSSYPEQSSPSPPYNALALVLSLGIGGAILAFDPRVSFYFGLSSLFNVPKYMVMALAAMAILVLITKYRNDPPYQVRLLDLAIGIYFLSTAWSCVINGTPVFFWLDWIGPEVSALIFMIGAALLGSNYRTKDHIGKWIVLISGILSLIVFYEAIGGYAPWSIYRRPVATIGSRNLVSAVLGLALPLAITRVIINKKALDGVVLALIISAILICRTRSVWLASVITITLSALSVVAISYVKSITLLSRRAVISLLTLLSLACLTVYLLPTSGLSWRSNTPLKDSFNNLFDYNSGGGQARLKQHILSYAMFRDAPWLGYGVGGFRRVGPLYVSQIPDLNYYPFPETQRPQSELLRILVHGGIFALGAAFLAIAGLIYSCVRAFLRQPLGSDLSPQDLFLDIALCSTLFFVTIHALFDVSASRPPVIVMVAVIAGLLRSYSPIIAKVSIPRWSVLTSLVLGGILLVTTFFRFIAALIFYPDPSFANLRRAEKWFPMPIEAAYFISDPGNLPRYRDDFRPLPSGFSHYLAEAITGLPYDLSLLRIGATDAIQNGDFDKAKTYLKRGLAIAPRDLYLLQLTDQLPILGGLRQSPNI